MYIPSKGFAPYFLTLWLCMLGTCLRAQNRKVIDRSLILQKDFYIPELKCIQGKKLIESFLLRDEGITEISTNLSTRSIKVSYIKVLTSPERISVLITNTGYGVDTFSPNMDARRLLPLCCIDTFTNATVKTYYDMEREKYKKLKKRYREPKSFRCCRSCDIVAKYRGSTP